MGIFNFGQNEKLQTELEIKNKKIEELIRFERILDVFEKNSDIPLKTMGESSVAMVAKAIKEQFSSDSIVS